MAYSGEDLFAKLKALKADDNIAGIRNMLAEDMVFHTPRFFRPVTNHDQVIAILNGIMKLLPDFQWTRSWSGEGSLVLEFKGHVNGGKTLAHGIDIFEFDAEGKIQSLTVFLRPPSALEEIGEQEDRMVREMMAQAGNS